MAKKKRVSGKEDIDACRHEAETRKNAVPVGLAYLIIDNSDSDWRVKGYLHEWADLAHKFDVATAYLKKFQAPVGVKATLKAWMELS